jgi:RNA polymerase sigma-70 factor (ECF subfamily)
VCPNANTLLEELGRGDTTAAEKIFLTYEPYLRMVVRRQLSSRLRSKFDSIDIVQSVWAALLPGFRERRWTFVDAAHLEAFLVKVTRYQFVSEIRRHKDSVRYQQPLADYPQFDVPAPGQPHPSDAVQASDIWEQLLAVCPPRHREILHLKRQGVPLAEIATRTGLHKSSVRRILYEVARRFAFLNDGQPSLRRAL